MNSSSSSSSNDNTNKQHTASQSFSPPLQQSIQRLVQALPPKDPIVLFGPKFHQTQRIPCKTGKWDCCVLICRIETRLVPRDATSKLPPNDIFQCYFEKNQKHKNKIELTIKNQDNKYMNVRDGGAHLVEKRKKEDKYPVKPQSQLCRAVWKQLMPLFVFTKSLLCRADRCDRRVGQHYLTRTSTSAPPPLPSPPSLLFCSCSTRALYERNLELLLSI